ncbi:MAG TPA: hypothetical protein VEL74_20600 [Thermoanaerobaculia bacterium]|nr:hypothetical protein [Thermoanaerobaculia bacterium]
MRKMCSGIGIALLAAVAPMAASAQELIIEHVPAPAKAVQMMERVNAKLEAGGSDVRLSEASFFTVGQGTSSARVLRIGTRWPYEQLTYVLDASGFTADVPAADTEGALVSSFESWNNVNNTTVNVSRIADDGGNFDILDAVVLDAAGNCVDIYDVTSPNLIGFSPTGGVFIEPEADIVVGGWLPASYFANCLGSANIIGITWTFSVPDQDGDNYRDTVYVEQFYNEGFQFVTNGAAYLNFNLMDIESIAVHENGHALGLDHFGGPNTNQPFRLQPNGKVYDPEAVMNPAYLGGTAKRTPLPTDEAGLRTLFGRKGN